VTLWRHLHILRSMLPAAAAIPTSLAAAVQVCARRPRADRATIAASVAAGAQCATARTRPVATDPPRSQHKRLIGESIRTWLAGTFHGVTARHLPNYLREYMARTFPPFVTVGATLNALDIPTDVDLRPDHAYWHWLPLEERMRT
ncbi:MAG TPA: hypothetical protein VGO62_14730, partial [Myxococcota bacterium]